MSLFSGENPVLGTGTTVQGVKPQLYEHIVIPLSATSVAQYVFISPGAYKVASVRTVFATTSTSGTLNVEKLTGTQAPGSGVAVLAAPALLSGTVNTDVSSALNATASNYTLAAGDCLATVIAGTMTGLANALLVIVLQKL